MGDYDVSVKVHWLKQLCPYGEGCNNGEGYACVGSCGIWEISILSSQFCYKPKTVLKIK